MAHRGVHVRRDIATEHGERSDVFRHQLGDDGLRARAGVRRFTGEHFVGHRGQRVDIGATVDRAVTGRLLGRHVLRRAEREARLRDARAAGVRNC